MKLHSDTYTADEVELLQKNLKLFKSAENKTLHINEFRDLFDNQLKNPEFLAHEYLRLNLIQKTKNPDEYRLTSDGIGLLELGGFKFIEGSSGVNPEFIINENVRHNTKFHKVIKFIITIGIVVFIWVIILWNHDNSSINNNREKRKQQNEYLREGLKKQRQEDIQNVLRSLDTSNRITLGIKNRQGLKIDPNRSN